ncbi:aminomethyl-transferring glycine dehydrogenase [Yersinia enterocolitica]|uniref:Glycine dehydrogenase (decarboxylating) n=1 Tax=Yersinia enterocolitica serotype O:8 / biotype 1B (strain NCTC 13174 / 8081) TaxID=393305 RepID=GCSP_YERE8|nr:aminomethyl-transferring glycine dehydrogenase [Yersinia enterocolitica]A1JPN3.1 RecName: Full=Glycine dehydrogenase (decarboxylating); AltName: Full=Glycine cleavage system P-protein; AltName: Full=Glycine decarboxylase; AltName: Full=Glycine dehydrogenase (aminomethyl-transferring) [Yersinia enterocolitica subsp. enterocolitica 8081]AJJ23395.1 glycine dehydrogenase [Yersinia enterocolitica]CAL13417.1 glycine dehydrogenase [Yersinia enterocolitica subsp. enterocolitica 8081]CRY25970.1 glyci
MTQNLSQLEHNDAFIQRHIGSSAEQQQQMLAAVGANSLSTLIQQIVPADIQLPSPPPVGEAATEHQALAELKGIASQNQRYKSYIGMGYSPVLTPPVILRNMLENPGWYTAYTPYQPEVSQGRLEALLNFQQLTQDLTGLDLASASLLDEATAAAESMALAKRASKLKDANRFFVADDVHPQTLDVVLTRAETFGFEVIVDRAEKVLELDGVFGVLLQQVGTTGELHDYSALLAELKKRKIITSVAADIMALVLLTAPGKQGADVVFGSAQRFGVPMGYGGPHAAFFACRDEFKRSMPGRIIGVSRDAAGNTALRMAMQTREQHIRREKANSNICTSQVLLANIASLYAVYHGPQGLQRIAGRIHRMTDILAAGLQQAGLALRFTHWFDTLTVEVKDKAAVLARALSFGINLRTDIHGAVGITLDETTSREDLQILFTLLVGDNHGLDIDLLDAKVSQNSQSIQTGMLRQEPILTHPVFNRYHSETEMMRYMHRLERKDLALNQAMIPLGSCTMKLNAAAEMIPITWPEFAELHPFCPPEQAAGYQQMIGQLSQWLVQLTGYDAVCMQPNSGAQGEYAGLLAIRRYHESRNQASRHICLIPSSAHGTNPASAQMAGMSVVVVACDKQGNIDLHDLRQKAGEAGDELSCIMVTYPSTHGVYEETIREVCQIVHQFGGQVYLDGANMNAQVGITTPGYIGADVSHLNLHKTFCIPHGGGGPGMGPIGVKAHLAPFVPGHSVVQIDGMTTQQGAVSAAPFGSASILPISWMYIRMMGADGLKQASQVAILNANYIATRLKEAYPVLYTGHDGSVAHECILDIRPLKEATGISEMDIAKRLIDFGFHAPTMSFPVAGTLMVEPTESESKVELDRFIDAMLAIRAEIEKVARGEWPLEDNPLVNAPHTQAELVGEWQHPYSRELAVFPVAGVMENKYWPSVKRLDDVYGDRNLFCSCVPISDYE